MKLKRLGLAAAAGAAAIAAGVAYATIPDVPSGVFHGCYALDGGTLRVVDTGGGQTCDAGTEVPLDWNITGAQGPTGPVGPQGPQGFVGPSGLPGNSMSSGYEQVAASFTTGGNGLGTGEADCPDGQLAVGGGVEVLGQTHPTASRPTDDGGGWTADVRGDANKQYSVYAICVYATAKGV